MIAKFKSGDGWSFHECVKIDLCRYASINGLVPYETFAAGSQSPFFYHGPAEKNPECKVAHITRKDGTVHTILYAQEAYLLNDKGDTINAI